MKKYIFVHILMKVIWLVMKNIFHKKGICFIAMVINLELEKNKLTFTVIFAKLG